MDDEKKEEKTAQEMTEPEETAQPSDAEQALSDATLQAAKDDENTVSTNPQDWESMYNALLKENEQLKQQYKERFAGSDGPTETVQNNIELADKVGSGQAESQTYEDLFNAKVDDTKQAIKNTAEVIKRSFTKGDGDPGFTPIKIANAVAKDVKPIAKDMINNFKTGNRPQQDPVTLNDFKPSEWAKDFSEDFPNTTKTFKDLFSNDEDKEGR